MISTVLRELLRPPRRARVVLVLVGAALVGALLWYLGLDVLRSVVAGVILAVIGISWVAVPDHEATGWVKDAVVAQDGARREVTQLSWALHPRRGRVRHGAHVRVQQLARNRLALHQLELADPADRTAIERLVGSAVYSTLRPRPDQSPPRLRDIVRCLDALDALDALDSLDAPGRLDAQSPHRHPSKEQNPA
jgi:hypothetical protein